MRPVAKRKQSAQRAYARKRKLWLFNKVCVPCFDQNTITLAAEIHHKKGRLGDRLLDDRHWIAVCRSCHDWITKNPAESMKRGYSEDRLR